jgi:hypothetical protein
MRAKKIHGQWYIVLTVKTDEGWQERYALLIPQPEPISERVK